MGTGWTIDSGVASSDGSQGGDADLSQTILTNAKTYLVTYTISNYSAGMLSAVAGSTGRVTNAQVEGITGPAGSCIAKAVRKAKFPKFQQSTFKVKFPFRL